MWTFAKAKGSLTPAVLFTICISYSFYCDFVVRGYDHPFIDVVPWIDVVRYQFIILFIYIFGVLYAWIRESRNERQIPIRPFANEQPIPTLIAEGGAWIIVCLEVGKRLYTTDWSVTAAITASLQARGDNPWGSKPGPYSDSTFAFTLIYYMLPLAGILFGTNLVAARGRVFNRLRNLLGLFAVIVLASTYGSRTYTAIPILFFALRYLYSPVPAFKKAMVLCTCAASIVVLFSVIVLYRSEGIGRAFEKGDVESKGVVKYHQDDSYYRILNSAYVSEHSRTKEDFAYFVYTVLVNPVPRSFWPGKPLLTADFYGEYKKSWVTVTFLGECIAFFGVIWGSVAALLMMMLFYQMLSFATRFVYWPLGTGLLLVFTLYTYQCMRAMANFTASVYMFVGMLMFSYALRAGSKQKKRTVLNPRVAWQRTYKERSAAS
jgi:hypothetical protein